MNKTIIIALALALAAPALAADNTRIVKSTITGRGCPIGNNILIVTNSIPNGPADKIQLIFENFIVKNTAAGVAKQFKKSCKLSIDLKVPAGYTLGSMEIENEGYTDRGEQDTKMILDTNLDAGQLNSSNRLRRYPFALMSRNSIEGDFSYPFSFNDIGDTSASSCDEERVVRLELDLVLTLKTSRRSTENAMARLNQVNILIPTVEGSNAVACDDGHGNPWWWGW